MGPRGPPRASKTQNPAFAKTLKNNLFLRFLGSRGLPREAPEAHEGSQEAPKELQDLKNKGSKNEPEKYQFLDQFWAHFGSHFGVRIGSKIGPKLVLFWGPFLEPVFVDFEILGGRPLVARRYTLSGKVPRAASRAVLFTNYQAPSIQGPVPFTKHRTDLTRPGPRAGEFP